MKKGALTRREEERKIPQKGKAKGGKRARKK